MTGDWTTYEDIVQRFHPLGTLSDFVQPNADDDTAAAAAVIGFNNIGTIEAKVAAALRARLGGVMVWEVGQDCRLVETKRSGRVHGVTCPYPNSSLLLAVTRTVQRWEEEYQHTSHATVPVSLQSKRSDNSNDAEL